MDESAPIRAIVIGVSTLLAVATISAVLMYYNSAKQLASNVGRGQDFAANYEQSIQDLLVSGTENVTGNSYITGADVKNLINYFYDKDDVEVNIRVMRVINVYEENKSKAAATYSKFNINHDEASYKYVMNNILLDQKFKIKCTENHHLTGDKVGTLIEIEGQ